MWKELTAGQHIAERYRLIALRGTGGTASVWRAQRLSDGREVALKLLHSVAPERAARMHERFLREARAASAIDSPYVVRVFDYGLHGEIPFLAMELLEGATLAGTLSERGPLSPMETCRIVDQIAEALTQAHELGIVHRDLKPENIFLVREPHGTIAKVLDFGIAKVEDEPAIACDLTGSGALLGTPRYMSPEQIEGARHVDAGADLWALSVIAFECMTGQQPFRGDSLRALFAAICLHPPPRPSALAAVPGAFDAWFARGAHRDAGKRFRSAKALATALREACEGELAAIDTADEPVAAAMSGTLPPRVTVKRAPSWLILAIAGGAIAGIGWVAVQAVATSAKPELAPALTRAERARRAVHSAEQLPSPAVSVRAPVLLTPQPSATGQPPVVAVEPVPPPVRRAARAQDSTALPAQRMKRAASGARQKFDLDLLLRDRK